VAFELRRHRAAAGGGRALGTIHRPIDWLQY
jgi:hypothetical protein